MNSTLMNILDADRRRGLENVREATARIWARPLHRYYTDHTVDHSERIIALLDGLTAGMMATDKRLSPTEVFVLLAAAYLHDVGMQNEKFVGGDLEEIRAHHNEQTAEMIYSVFEDPAHGFTIPLVRDPGIVEAVALVAKGYCPEYELLVHGDETVRLRLLAALLRFGDELDIDHRRVDLEQMRLLDLSVESQLYWWKCHYVSGVSIVDEYIRVAYRFPQDRPDYERVIVPLLEGEVRAKHTALEEIFRANAVKVALGAPRVYFMRLVRPLPAEVEALAWQKLDMVEEAYQSSIQSQAHAPATGVQVVEPGLLAPDDAETSGKYGKVAAIEGLSVSEPTEEAQQIQLALLRNLYEQGLLSKENYHTALVGLGAERQIIVAGDYYAGAPGAPTLVGYLRHVVETNRRLQLQGIRSAGRLVSIDLEEVYVTLTATERRTVAAEETWVDEMTQLAPGEVERMKRPGVDHLRETVTQVKVKVQEALAAHLRLVVLGDPGCGKTTLLRYLALTFARDLLGEAGLVARRLELSEQRLPILLPLRDFAHYLEAHHPDPSTDGPKLLLDYLRTYFAHQDIALPERFFADRLERGECAVLLDGVDEVADFATRHRVARIIERFTIAYPDNRYVVTSRVVGYTTSARLGEGYAVTRVRDFTQADIERFVTYWNRAVETALAGGETPYALREARRQTEVLLRAIQDNDRVRELTVNPLLLTVIALVQRYRAQLPERRTELYEEAIEVLLGRWDEAKGMETRAVMAGRELDAGDRRSLLEPVALWMMEQRIRQIEAVELRRQLGERFFEMCGDRQQAIKAVDEFLQLINERSGLLAERGQGVYAFSHLTFQEHLAARAVADRPDYIAYTLDRLDDSWWREVILLEAGYLSTQGKRRVTALIQSVMDHREEPEPYHNLVLAAEALRDVGLARVEGDLWGELQRRLRREFEQPLRRPREFVWQAILGRQPSFTDIIRRRAVAAEALAQVESGRSGTQPAFWRLPHGEPVWVDVPGGEFWMGSERGDDDERPVYRVYLGRFQIARVPVTNAQYWFFVEAMGYRPPDHWEDGRPPRGLESHPVVYLSWHDALAYCRWLSGMTGKPITVPSEAQWEKAARGDKDRREYPWGDEWDETRCNTDELGLGDTTPVGIFPEGVSPYGCLDMAGNVWEWCSSIPGEYPYDSSDGRENLEAGDKVLRMLRGGSFLYYRNHARCAFRGGNLPDFRDRDFGFRVVISPISPSSAL